MSQYYVGVKIVFAWKEVRDGKEGYAVKYPDGYTSWAPKAVFEAAYLPMGETNDNTVTQEMVSSITKDRVKTTELPDGKTTLVKCKMATGFVQYETSSCVDPKNYDTAVGEQICIKRIEEAVWKFLGFVVQWGKYGINTNIGLNQKE